MFLLIASVRSSGILGLHRSRRVLSLLSPKGRPGSNQLRENKAWKKEQKKKTKGKAKEKKGKDKDKEEAEQDWWSQTDGPDCKKWRDWQDWTDGSGSAGAAPWNDGANSAPASAAVK